MSMQIVPPSGTLRNYTSIASALLEAFMVCEKLLFSRILF